MKAAHSLWSRHEHQYKKSGFGAQRRYPNESLIQFLAAHYFQLSRAHRRNTKILEIGCGSGANLWMLAREGFDAYGVDAAPTAVRLCKQMLRSWKVSAHVSKTDMRALPFPGSSFDAIVDVVSMQHTTLAEHASMYHVLFSILKSKGCFFSYHLGSKSSSFHEARSGLLDQYTVKSVNNPKVPLHSKLSTCFIPESVMKSLLHKVGFVNITIEKVTRTYKTGKIVEYLVVEAQKP
ncbi:MAG: class I SAM-dependent methyltransferase [bacterium]|nr:class I SAM-dependent methyltransferase [bacterium]